MDLNLFKKRLNELYSCWRKHKEDLWGNSDVLVISKPPSNPPPNLCNPISSFFFFWLMGHDLPDTTAIFTQKEIYLICEKNKVSVLETLAGPAMEAVHAHVSVFGKDGGDDGLVLMDDIIRRMTPLAVIGYIPGEFPKMQLLWSLKHTEYQFVPVNNGLSRLSKLFNIHGNKKVKNLGNGKRRDFLRSREGNNSRVDSRFHGNNGRESQMQCVSDTFKEIKDKGNNAAKLSPKAEEKKPLFEKEKGNASMSVCEHVEELEGGNSGEYILLDQEEEEEEEEDEWVLIV